MSDEKRDYPAWLDEELFGALNVPETPAPEEGPLEARKASELREPGETPQTAAEPHDADRPVKKKKKSTADDSPDKPKKKKASEDGDKPKKKKAAAAEPEAPKKKKAPAADPEAPKKKKAPAEAESPKKKKASADAVEGAQDAPATEKPKAKKKKKRVKKGARGVVIALLVLAFLLIAFTGAALGAGYLITNDDKNLPNVYLGEIYVGGMTRDEAVQALHDGGWEKLTGGTLKVTLPEGVSFEADYLQAGMAVPAEVAADAAFLYGHDGDWIDNLVTYIGDLMVAKDLSPTEFTLNEEYVAGLVDKAVDEFETVTKGEEYSVNEEASTLEVVKGAGQITLDRAAIKRAVGEALVARKTELVWDDITGEVKMPDFQAIAATLTSEVKDAYYDAENDVIVPEVKGVEIDVESAEKLWQKAEVLQKISIPITLVDPEITAESLEAYLFRDQLGVSRTPLAGSTANRISNIRLACSRFDGMILLPGEHFSYNTVVGERTEEAGFKPAPVYNGTAHEVGLGGGICQVSSTLYNAVLASDLQVDARTCHSMLVGYLPAGLDATVDWPSTDFAFTNNSEYPIRILASVDDSGRWLTIEIWGTNLTGLRIEPRGAMWEVYDDTYDDVQIGWGAAGYKYYFDADGNQVDKVKIDNSYYHIPEDEINWHGHLDEPHYDEDDEDYDDSGSGSSDNNTQTTEGGDIVYDINGDG